MEKTPQYQIPYLTPTDVVDDWPPYYRQLAERLDTVIAGIQPLPGMQYACASIRPFTTSDASWHTLQLMKVAATSAFTVEADGITATRPGVYQVVASVPVGAGTTSARHYIRVPPLDEANNSGGFVSVEGQEVRGLCSINAVGLATSKLKLEFASFVSGTTSGLGEVYGGTFTVIRLGDA
ncbi:hypothetical protein RCO28_37995 [Streptomyces sp. LHD-70]|uniref:hypothetical protein n=1 Tax=Streptomyces sp. LHD-70 TaxID=3072140 RepID=UPI00280F0185|nr:hypothetical protein [Streptomyces sp. LHD-70]MDQ8708211.1 hypothetical protein [Streptomyces sp. LHD-70]